MLGQDFTSDDTPSESVLPNANMPTVLSTTRWLAARAVAIAPVIAATRAEANGEPNALD